MKERIFFVWVIVLFTTKIFSQSLKTINLEGKLTVNDVAAENVNVRNERTAVVVRSKPDGSFLIEVALGDVLEFTSVNIDKLRSYVSAKVFQLGYANIRLQSKSYELKEVVIEKEKITSESLGIVSNVKRYTPAERRLRAAGDAKPLSVVSMLFGGKSLDGLINAISGRTSMLKKELLIEKKEKDMLVLESLFEEDYIIKKYNIPEINIKGFKFFLIEDSGFCRSLKTRNKTLIEFTMAEMATKYLKLQNENN